jgi:hypothetical protein
MRFSQSAAAAVFYNTKLSVDSVYPKRKGVYNTKLSGE